MGRYDLPDNGEPQSGPLMLRGLEQFKDVKVVGNAYSRVADFQRDLPL
jgi:hypothetical protein